MRRFDAIRAIVDVIGDAPVVCTLGHTSQELFKLGDRPQNFYMLGSMGLASSIAAGLALSLDRKIIAIEGDAAIAMNMGSLATLGYSRPKNLVLVVIDNRANGATGFQPSMTSRHLRIDEIARGCGIEHTSRVRDAKDLQRALRTALDSPTGPHLVLVEAEIGVMPGIDVLPIGPIAIRDRFRESLGVATAPRSVGG